MSKKYAAVSSWGFSGYITVLPKDETPAPQTREKEEDAPAKAGQESKSASSASFSRKSVRSLTT